MELLFQNNKGVYESTAFAKEIANWNKNSKFAETVLIQYKVGDWVLMSKANMPSLTSKLAQIWSCPMRVTDILANNVYQLTDLNGKTHTVHASLMWFYLYEPNN